MKKIAVLLMLMCSVLAKSQTIHWLTFIDTVDKEVGEVDKTGRQVLYNHFINVVNAALAEKGYKSQIHDYYDTSMTPQACKDAVSRLKCGPEDIVVFYYIGHGTHAASENNPYPQLCLGQDDESRFVPLKWIHDTLKGKNPRLTVTVGMCCNSVQGARAKKEPSFALNYGSTKISDREKSAIQKMFLQKKGDYLATSASVGQNSIACETDFGWMDLYTAVLVSLFEDGAYDGNLEWDSLFIDLRNEVDEVTGGKQTPIYASNVRVSSIPANKSQSRPTQTVIPAKDTSAKNRSLSGLKNILSAHFDFIVDSTNPLEDRMKLAAEIKSVCQPGTIVKTISQDGNVVVDRENIDVFLGRISTSRKILKIIPVRYKVDNQKITGLSVQEVYRK